MVVTIVVLLILAGVSISLIVDNNGIIKRSKDAREQYGQARENEQADLESISNFIEEIEESKPKVIEPKNIEDWGYTEEDDETITINSYKGKDTTVIIPNYINGKPVKKIECDNYAAGATKNSIWDSNICENNFHNWYWKEQKTIKKIIISEGIENIGSNAFNAGVGLESIIIPNSVTSIGDCAFYDCIGLTNITIPNSVTSIGSHTFYGCTALTSITIPNSVTSIGDCAFYDCTGLTNITIPSSVTTMGDIVFWGIPSVTVNVPFKEGETPEGWSSRWNNTSTGYNVTVNYLK